jgi:hypothetical protein
VFGFSFLKRISRVMIPLRESSRWAFFILPFSHPSQSRDQVAQIALFFGHCEMVVSTKTVFIVKGVYDDGLAGAVLADGCNGLVDIHVGQVTFNDNGGIMGDVGEFFQKFHAISEGLDTIAHGLQFSGDELADVFVPLDEDDGFHAWLRKGEGSIFPKAMTMP